MSDKLELLLREVDRTEPRSGGEREPEPERDRLAPETLRPDAGRDGRADGTLPRKLPLERGFASEYLDELVIALLFRCEEANGMDIIREFTHLFGVQFSPGTVYPHLHSLEEEGVLACRECVRTKEYCIDDRDAARERLRSTVTQLSRLGAFLDAAVPESESDRPGESRTPPTVDGRGPEEAPDGGCD